MALAFPSSGGARIADGSRDSQPEDVRLRKRTMDDGER